MARLLALLAALSGAAGVTLAALAAHAYPSPSLVSAASMLSFHAPALLAAAAGLRMGLLHRPLGAAGGLLLAAGAALFAGDIALRTFAGQSLFPMAAPAGGTAMILGWLLLGGAALAGEPG